MKTKAVLMRLLLILMLCSVLGSQIIMPSVSNASYSVSLNLKVTPECPFPWDNVNVTVSFTLGCPHDVKFGDVIRDGNIFSVYITVTEYPGYVIQVVTTYTHTYHLGELSPGSYQFIVYAGDVWFPLEWARVTFTVSQEEPPYVDLSYLVSHIEDFEYATVMTNGTAIVGTEYYLWRFFLEAPDGTGISVDVRYELNSSLPPDGTIVVVVGQVQYSSWYKKWEIRAESWWRQYGDWITVRGQEVEMTIENVAVPLGEEISAFMLALTFCYHSDSQAFDLYLYDSNYSLFSYWSQDRGFFYWVWWGSPGYSGTLRWNLYRHEPSTGEYTTPPPGDYYLVGALVGVISGVGKTAVGVTPPILIRIDNSTITPITKTWTVDDDGPADFSSIQEAINAANPEDTIFVHSGTYYENVVVNKTVSLIGENKTNTIIDGCGEGVVLHIRRTQNVSVDSFTIRNGIMGLSLDDSSYTCFRNVDLVGSEFNFRFSAMFGENFIHDIENSATVNYRPIYYWVNKQDKEVPIDAGYVALINCSRIVLRNLNLEHNYDGITFFNVRDSVIENVSISHTLHGLYLRWNCTNNIIQRNIMTNNSAAIVLQRASSNNNVTANIIMNNNDGIGVDRSLNNSLSRNFIVNNENGICLFETRNNIISENDVLNNTRGIRIQDTYNNSIYHNNFINNEYQVYPLSGYTISTNLWDDGYPSGGNYWSDYEQKHPNAKEIDDSGIWNTPYVIDENNQDRYPLMSPRVQDLTPPITIDDYDDLWHTTDFTITLTATDDMSGVAETYYKINGGLTKTVSGDGQPFITTEGANNTLEYWSIDNADNEEFPHNILTEIKLDKTKPTVNAGDDQDVAEDTLVTFDSSTSWDENGIATCTWTFIDVTPQTLNGTKLTYNFTTPGTYIVTLTVEDSAGNIDTDTVTITVLLDTDSDGTPDVTDTDDDNDGVPDADDAFPLSLSESVDTDGDGVGNNSDIDDDNDGMPDTWETENELNPLDATDASLDPDGDGLTNLQEYEGDTNPNVSDAEAVPLWILGATAAAIIGIAAALTILWRRRK